MGNPRVTVAVLTRNRPHFLRIALDSILAQRDVEFEVLVLDNASTDETPDLVRSYADPRLRYLLNSGLDFIEFAVAGRPVEIPPPIFVFRSDVLRRAGPADSPHTRGTIDMNLYFRVAAISDFVFVPKVLVHYRGHDRSETQLINDTGHGVARFAAMAERVDAIAYLLRSNRAARASYRNWLAERLLDAHCNQSVAIHPCVPQMWHSWDDCRAIALDHLERVIPKGEAVVLIDDEQLGIGDTFNGRRVIPFLERDGEYYGPPDNDAQGIEQLEHLPSDVRWLAIAWSSFWWLDHYGQLRRHLEKQAACRAVTPYIRIYELVRKPHVKFTYHRRAADAKPAELPAPGAR